MKRMSKLFLYSLTSLTVLASSVASAEEMVTAPTFEGGVTASVGTFFVVPSTDNTGFGTISSIDGDEEIINIANAEAGYDFGWEASLGYIFEDTANGIELAYRGINTSDTASTTPGENFLGASTIQDHLNYKLNSADLMISQFLDVGQQMQVRLSGGLAYLNLEQKQTINVTNTDTPAPPVPDADPVAPGTREFNEKSNYNGWGPRVSLDSRYGFNEDGDDSGFGIVGGASLAYFLGTNDTSISSTLNPKATTEALRVGTNAQENLDNQVVTNLRANLGIDYVYFFDNEQSTIGLELGYLVDYYADAIASYNQENTTGSILTSTIDSSSLTFSGPYLNLKGVF